MIDLRNLMAKIMHNVSSGCLFYIIFLNRPLFLPFSAQLSFLSKFDQFLPLSCTQRKKQIQTELEIPIGLLQLQEKEKFSFTGDALVPPPPPPVQPILISANRYHSSLTKSSCSLGTRKHYHHPQDTVVIQGFF